MNNADFSLPGVRLIQPEDGKRLNVMGDRQRVILTGEDTGGAYALVENRNDPGAGPPFHVHRKEDEMFHVVEGQVEFRVGDQTVLAAAGTTVHLPRNTPHTFKVAGDAPARMLIMLVPAGLEKFFEEMSQLGQDGPPDLEQANAICARYGIEILSDREPAA